MRQWLLPLAVVVLPGGALVAAAWWWWRRPATAPPVAAEEGERVPKVYNDALLSGLTPALVQAVEAYELEGPIPIRLISGRRTDAEQAALYAKGRTAPGEVVTNARTAADSAHGRGAAFDFAPVREVSGGRVRRVWLGEEAPEKYALVGQWFEARGLAWGGRWKNLYGFGEHGDSPHLEVPNWRALPLA